MWKKIICILSIAFFVIALAGCGSSSKTSVKKATTKTEQNTMEWNTTEVDARKNGNMQVAIKTMQGKNLVTLAKNADVATVFKRPWDYYGQVIRFTGEVSIADDYPAGSKAGKLMGGECSEIVMVIGEDEIPVDIICKGSSKGITEGQVVTVCAYPIGTVDVKNQLGGTSHQLMAIGVISR